MQDKIKKINGFNAVHELVLYLYENGIRPVDISRKLGINRDHVRFICHTKKHTTIPMSEYVETLHEIFLWIKLPHEKGLK